MRRSRTVTLADLVVAVHEAADSPREALAALDHLLRSQRVSFARPTLVAARLGRKRVIH